MSPKRPRRSQKDQPRSLEPRFGRPHDGSACEGPIVAVDASEMSLDVDLEARTANFHCWNRDTDADASEVLDLAEDPGWVHLATLVSGGAEKAGS